MKVTMVSGERVPVPPIFGGPIPQTLFETAVSIRDPELTVISRWSDALKGLEIHPAHIFYHVDIDAQRKSVKDALGDRMPAGMGYAPVAQRFYYLNGVTGLLHDIDPDVIQVHGRPDFMPYLMKQFPGKRTVLYMHSETRFVYMDGPFDAVVHDIDRLVFVSRYLSCRFISRYPACAPKVTVIHNSVDTDKWHPKVGNAEETERVRRDYGLPRGRTVLFVGRTVPGKGLHCLLDAMEVVRCKAPDAKLLVVGSPGPGTAASRPYLERLKKRASLMGDAVAFTGYVDNNQTPYLYAAADVTVVPSLYREAFGKVVAESMATGVPVIASRRGGIPELIDDGIDGLLVENPEDAESLADPIVELLEHPIHRQEMGAAARRKAVEHFASPIRLARVRAFYTSLEKELHQPGGGIHGNDKAKEEGCRGG